MEKLFFKSQNRFSDNIYLSVHKKKSFNRFAFLIVFLRVFRLGLDPKNQLKFTFSLSLFISSSKIDKGFFLFNTDNKTQTKKSILSISLYKPFCALLARLFFNINICCTLYKHTSLLRYEAMWFFLVVLSRWQGVITKMKFKASKSK